MMFRYTTYMLLVYTSNICHLQLFTRPIKLAHFVKKGQSVWVGKPAISRLHVSPY